MPKEEGIEQVVYVPARMLNEYVYCPRLAYIEWVTGDFKDNYYVVDGKFKHRVVDKEKGEFPDEIAEEDTFHARSLWLSSENERLTSRLDLVEAKGKKVTVVDYKRGRAPDIEGSAWLEDKVQLCAQALILRDNGYHCDKGIVYYIGSKARVEVSITDDLIDFTRNCVKELIDMAESGNMPPPLENSKKCDGCSIAGICMPDEINLLTSQPVDKLQSEPQPIDTVRRLTPARDNAMPLYVQEQGSKIGVSGELLTVTHGKTVLGEMRLFETSQVCVFGNIQITTQTIRELCSRSIPLTYFSMGGWFYGILHGMSHKNVELRIFQYSHAQDKEKCLKIARILVYGKIKNCRTMLMRNCNTLTDKDRFELSQLADKALAAQSFESLLGIEGLAAKVYFSNFQGMIKITSESAEDRAGLDFNFESRNKRPPTDPVNCLLSYAYSLLTKDLTVTLLGVGLDPFLGFYHQPRYGKPALALDLMEEFRPIIGDSVVLWAINNKIFSKKDFVKRGKRVGMRSAGRKKFLKAYESRMDTLVSHPVFNYRISYRRALEVQARLLGRYIRGEIPEYIPFLTR